MKLVEMVKGKAALSPSHPLTLSSPLLFLTTFSSKQAIMNSPQGRAALGKLMEGFRKAQQQGAQGFAKAGGSGGSSGGPNMNGAVGGGAGIILLVAAGIGINSSLFNGQYREEEERWKSSAV